MDQAALMGVMHRFADFGHQFEPLPRVEFMLDGVLEQGFAADELHSEEWLEAFLGFHRAGFIDLGNARMLEARQGLSLAAKAPKKFLVRQARLNDFERDDPARVLLLSLVDRTMPPSPIRRRMR